MTKAAVWTLAPTAAMVRGVARAADQALLGSMFEVKNPSTPDKHKITFKAKEIAS